MYIKSIILDGFKSYAQRTEITNFDKYFNAITGFNGSGKSNILDGICFLMGITNLSNVRAHNLQELIYKNGQTGIKKASVTITFDNSDPSNSPFGYEDTPEITVARIISMGGRSKYLLNGCNATNAKVHDLFCSIQLNVNNPNFLIMQGRITKVLNMKPKEILSLIEEATGTKAYEEKRKYTMELFAKKDIKIREIDQILFNELVPEVKKLKDERNLYLEHQKLIREFQHYSRVYTAYQYDKLKHKKIEKTYSLEQLSKQKENIIKENTQKKLELQDVEEEIKKIQVDIDKKSGNEFKLKQDELKEVIEKDIKNTSNYQYAVENLNNSEAKLTELLKNIEDGNLKISENKEIYEKLTEELIKLKSDKNEKENELNEAVNILQSASIGITGANPKGKSITDLILEATTKLTNSKNDLETEIYQLKKEVEQFESRNSSIVFKTHVNLPAKSKVHGLLSSLFDVREERFCTAIESAGGGKLFNVVVDSDDTAKIISKSGTLKKRVTFLALNRVKPFVVNDRAVKNAQNLVGKDNVWRAIDLVDYDATVAPAVEFMLGGTLICSDSKVAKKVVYDRSVGCRCVTIQGDVFESSGTLTGGSRPTSASLLLKQKEFRELNYSLNACIKEEKRLASEIRNLEAVFERYSELTKAISDMEHHLLLIKSKLKTSDRFQLEEKIGVIKTELEKAQKEQESLMKKIAEETACIADLEEKAQCEDEFNKGMVEKYKINVKNLKQEIEKMSKKMMELEKKTNDIEMINEELTQDIKNWSQQQTSIEKSINQLKTKIEDFECEMNNTKAKLEQLESAVNEIREAMNKRNEKIQVLTQRKTTINKDVFDTNFKLKEINQNIKDTSNDIMNCSKLLQETFVENKWIENEEKYFNNVGGDYDFNNMNMTQLKEKIDYLDKTIKKNTRNVNTRGLHILPQFEERVNELIRKKKIIASDRLKLEEIIRRLDVKKIEIIESSTERVDQEFGVIFSTILPGATAKLAKVIENNMIVGLEVKVCLGNTWKDNLGELSGGQRSLVALSLILAILSYKPAPLYILDEIDAALDLSHTRNIGYLLKTHFRQSQEGMFSNASVLFRTKFSNGISVVSRHVQSEEEAQKERQDFRNLQQLTT